MQDLTTSLSELVRSLSRLNNKNPGLLLHTDIERLERAKEVLRTTAHADTEPRQFQLVQSDEAETPDTKPERYTGIHDVQPLFSGNICNWPDWEASWNRALLADGKTPPTSRAVGYWAEVRDNYFNQGRTVFDSFKEFYHGTRWNQEPF